MLGRVLSVWFWFGSARPGFYLGTVSWITLILLMYAAGIQASLSLGPGGDFPRLRDVFLYAVSHDELSSLLVSVALLLLVGPCQERRWGTVAFLSLSVLTMTTLPLLYTLVLFIVAGEASRVCGSSAIQLALFTAQCRQVTQKRLLRYLPVWFLPWIVLLIGLLLLPGTPALLHFCAICIGHNYHQSFIKVIQEMEDSRVMDFIPAWAYIPATVRFRLPTYTTTERLPPQIIPVDQPAASDTREVSTLNYHTWNEQSPSWIIEESAALSEVKLLEEQMLSAGILASLQDTPDDLDAKVEVPKSSVSSLRLQQLEKMGFPTEKAVVALAASKQIDGAVSLLINDNIGEQAVVTKGRSPLPSHNT